MKSRILILIILLSVVFNSCRLPQNYYGRHDQEMSVKEQVVNFTKYIITEDESVKLQTLNTDQELNDFLVKFWKERDPSPGTEKNEFKEEHLDRFVYANLNFGGWNTDQARVFIIHGPPDEIIIDLENNFNESVFGDIEVWVYDEKLETPESPNIFQSIAKGKIKFVFADKMGFGYMEQIYSSLKNETVDARVYRMDYPDDYYRENN